MKKLFKLTTIILTLIPVSVLAKINEPNQPTGVPGLTLTELIGKVSDAILSIVGVLAILFIIIGGFQYVTSAGNPDALMKAKNTILWAVVGIVVAILAWSVVKFVVAAF